MCQTCPSRGRHALADDPATAVMPAALPQSPIQPDPPAVKLGVPFRVPGGVDLWAAAEAAGFQVQPDPPSVEPPRYPGVYPTIAGVAAQAGVELPPAPGGLAAWWARVERKVKWAAVAAVGASMAAAGLDYLATHVDALHGVPGAVSVAIAVLAPPLAAALAGYAARHTPRPDLSAPTVEVPLPDAG